MTIMMMKVMVTMMMIMSRMMMMMMMPFCMNPRRQGVTGKAWAATEARCHGKGLGSNGGSVSRERLVSAILLISDADADSFECLSSRAHFC